MLDASTAANAAQFKNFIKTPLVYADPHSIPHSRPRCSSVSRTMRALLGAVLGAHRIADFQVGAQGMKRPDHAMSEDVFAIPDN
jgi:hypothetical protein